MSQIVTPSLIPLSPELEPALQRVYEATPSYWAMYHLPGAPAGQAARDLAAMADEVGRSGMGILLPNRMGAPAEGAQLVGLLDFRLEWPEKGVVYIGMLMVADPFQRRGIGSSAWHLLEEWLVTETPTERARLAVEQFNPGALSFFGSLGFELTGEARRMRSGERFVRLLYMEKEFRSAQKSDSGGVR